MIKRSDLIILGEVDKTYLKNYKQSEYHRYSIITVKNIIYSKIHDIGQKITIESLEGFGSNENSIQLFTFSPRFYAGQKVIVQLYLNEHGNFKVTGAFRGKVNVKNNVIEGTRTSVDSFVESIKFVLNDHSSLLNVEYPSFEYQLYTQNKIGIHKIAHTGLHLSGQFYGKDDKAFSPSNHSIDFFINPANAKDKDNNSIPFTDIRTALISCCNQWNNTNVDDANMMVRQKVLSAGSDINNCNY